MLEMVQTKSAASSVTDHRGNIAVAGGGESASVISQHNNHRWRLFQVSIGERMERRGGVEERLLGVMPLNSVQLQSHSPVYRHTGNNRWFYFYLADFLFPSVQSIWLMLSINILLKCDKANESFNCCGTGGGSLAYICERLNVTTSSVWRFYVDFTVNKKAARALTGWAMNNKARDGLHMEE